MKRILAVFLVVHVTFLVCAWGQQPVGSGQQQPAVAQKPAAEPPVPMMTGRLRILILEGAGATNNTETHQGTPPVVEIRDENDRPVEGATVVFRLPPSGPGAVFPGQTFSRTLKSNSQGQVMANGMIPNDQSGAFRIHVTASSGNKIGEIDIEQINSSKVFAAHTKPTHKISTKWKLIAAGVAVGAVVGIVIALTGNSAKVVPPPVNPTITITPGPVTIGGH